MKIFTQALWALLLSVLLGLPTQAQRLAAGNAHTAIIHADGTLWAWGYNGSGQLGDGTYTTTATQVQVGAANTWASVASGATANHTVALRQDGTLWAWGANTYGQLGLGTTATTQPTPQQVGTSTWRSVAAGAYHTVAVRQDGTLWAWGYNLYGQLGYSTASTSQLTPAQVGTVNTWANVAAGFYHTVARRHYLDLGLQRQRPARQRRAGPGRTARADTRQHLAQCGGGRHQHAGHPPGWHPLGLGL